ncbi:peptide ABC transporter substrate-binding protein, partial [Psittacicella gerlachiana]
MIKWFGKGLSLTLVMASLLGTGLISTTSMAANIPQGTKLAAKQVLNIELGDNPASLDPNLVKETIGAQISSNLFEPLTTYDEYGKLIGGAAASWSHSADYKVWTFKLRPEAVWSDGTPVTAQDFVTSWQRLVDPNTASEYSYYLGDLGVLNAKLISEGKEDKSKLGIKAVDAHTLEVTLETPVPWFLEATSLIVLAPVPTQLVNEGKWPDFKNYVVNGPYLLQQAVPNERYTLVKNPKYWNAEKAVITEANFYVIRNANDAYKRLQAGDLNAFKLSTPALRQALQGDHNFKILEAPGSYTVWFTLNNATAPFNDLKVRQAVLYAINTQDLQTKVFRNSVHATSVYASAALPGVAENIKEAAYFTQPYPQRVEKAKELLAQAGYSEQNPLKFSISYNTNEMYKMASIAVQAQLKQVFGSSVQTTLSNTEWATFLSNRQAGLYQFYRAGWGADYYEPS